VPRGRHCHKARESRADESGSDSPPWNMDARWDCLRRWGGGRSSVSSVSGGWIEKSDKSLATMTALGVSEPDANGALLLESSDSGYSPGCAVTLWDIHPFGGVDCCSLDDQ